MKHVILPIVLALGLFGATRSARACGSGGAAGYAALVPVVIGAGIADLSFTVYDVASASSGKWSRGIGVAEVLIVGPQAALMTGLAMSTKPDAGAIAVAVWLDLLTIHGVVAVLSPSERARPPVPVGLTLGRRGKQQVTFAPTLVSDGRQLNPGLGAVGYF